MNYVKLTKNNLASEHICCAISNDKDPQVAAKKAWIGKQLDDGLTFLKADARGKCFIEYIPAENAWVPINADGYVHVNCFWVAGSLKGHGYANDLLDACIADAKANDKKGVTVISSPKKMSFLSDPKYLAHRGFLTADTAEPYFTLMYLPFADGEIPTFKACAKHPKTDGTGYTLYYTHGCPYTAKYVPLIENIAKENGVEFKSILLDTKEKAQNAPIAWTNYALFCDGKYLTNEIMSEKKFTEIIKGTGRA